MFLVRQTLACVCLAYVFVRVCDSKDHYKVGILASLYKKNWQWFMSQASALNIAHDKLVEDGVLSPDVNFSYIPKNTEIESDGVGNVVTLVREEDVDIIMGSPSSRNTIPSGHLTASWNFPHVTWSANSFDLSDKTLFRTLVRTIGPLSEVGKAIVLLFERFAWKKFAMLYIDYGVCLYSATGVKSEIATNNVTIMQIIAYPRETILTTKTIDSYLSLIRQTSRSANGFNSSMENKKQVC